MITTRFWSDGFVVDHLNPLDRYLFLYLLTNERVNIIGIYELSLRTASFETGIEKDNLIAMLGRLSPKVEYFDGWVYLKKFADHQTSSPKVELGMEREIRELPTSVIKSIKKLGFSSDRLRLIVDKVSSPDDTVSDGMDRVSHLTKLNLTKTKLKPNLTKPNGNKAVAKQPPVPSKEIDELIQYWKDEVGTNIQDSRTNRDYAAKLIRHYTLTEAMKLVKGAALAAEDRYAPGIANFSDLYRKQDKLLLWGKKRMSASDRPKVAIIS